MGHGDGQNIAGQMPTSGQGTSPYPPAGGVTAPGGYPAYSPGAGPSGGPASQPYPPQGHASPYPSQPPPGAMDPPTKPTGHGPPPTGYPGTTAPGGPYPPTGTSGYPPQTGPSGYPPHTGPSGYPPAASGAAPGYPVMGTPAAAPMGGMSVEHGGVPPGKEPCGCSAGWVLFGIGFIFSPCWIAAILLPICTKNRNDRLAAIGSGIALVILIIIGIIIGVLSRGRYY